MADSINKADPTEAARIQVLHELQILDTPPEERFDRITRLAAAHFSIPVVRITFVDEDRTWFKSSIGINATEAPRSISFCAETIQYSNLLVVPDLTKDPRFSNRPQVAGGPKFRFYAGVAIGPSDAPNVGTLCLMDYVPRPTFTEADAKFLQDLSEIINMELQAMSKLAMRTLELHESEERFALAMQSANDGLWDWDLKTNDVYYSPRWCSMLGYEHTEIASSLEDGLGHLVERDTYSKVLDQVDQYLSGAIDEFEAEFRMKHKNGFWIWVRSRAFMVKDAGEPIRLIGTHVDITEQKNLEEALLQAQMMEALGQLTGGIAADFNNLLSVIIGNAELLKIDNGENENIAAIFAAADRGEQLVTRLLAFCHNQALNPQAASLEALVMDMTSILTRAVGEQVKIETCFAPNLKTAYFDVGQTKSAILNLVTNARDAMPNGGVLKIECRNVTHTADETTEILALNDGDYVELSVTDTGTGMSEETKARVFVPFFTTKNVDEGSGLGLSMVYGFVKQSGGSISIDSEIERGTSIRIYLPTSQLPVQTALDKTPSISHEGIGE